MKSKQIYKYAITAGGGTLTVPVATPIDIIELYTSGAVVLAGAFTIASSGTPRAGYEVDILMNTASLTATGQVVTIFGEAIDSTLIDAATYLWIRATYSSASAKFIVTVQPNFDETTGFIAAGQLATDSVTTNKIADNAVTYAKIQDFAARGYLLRGGAAGAPEGFNAVTSGQLVMGNGTDVTSVAMSGDVTINGSGVTTIGAGKVTASMLAFSLASYLSVTRTLTSAEILALRTTAIDLIAAPGADKYLEIISASASLNYGAATYNAGADLLNLEINGVAVWTFPNSFVEATADAANQGTRVADAALAINTALKARMSSADPTVGDSTITITVIYRVNNII